MPCYSCLRALSSVQLCSSRQFRTDLVGIDSHHCRLACCPGLLRYCKMQQCRQFLIGPALLLDAFLQVLYCCSRGLQLSSEGLLLQRKQVAQCLDNSLSTHRWPSETLSARQAPEAQEGGRSQETPYLAHEIRLQWRASLNIKVSGLSYLSYDRRKSALH